MEFLIRVILFILIMLGVNAKHFHGTCLKHRKESKAMLIVFNIVCAITFFYMIFIYKGGIKYEGYRQQPMEYNGFILEKYREYY